MEYEVPTYPAEGVENVKTTVIENPEFISHIDIFGTYENKNLL